MRGAPRSKKTYLSTDGIPMINLYASNFPESVFIEIKDFQLAHQLPDFRETLIYLVEKGLGKIA